MAAPASTLQSYVNSATSAVQSGIASITGDQSYAPTQDKAGTKDATASSTSAIDDNTPDLKVDETPISPVERKNSLEKHLQHRPDAQDLKNRNILLDSKAAPYATQSVSRTS